MNPKETEVQGVAAFADVKDIPDTDLAILAIPAALCPDAVEMLAAEKQVKAFIILLPVLVRRPMRVLCWKIAYWKR